MNGCISLRDLLETGDSSQRRFEPGQVSDFPDAARRYFEHAILPGTPLARSVRLQMHGEIKLEDWISFKAEQVIHFQRGMIWQAKARMYGLAIRGFDRIVEGKGAMKWKLLGVIPVINKSGEDITRSTAGRLAAEFVWLPSAFLLKDVDWTIGNSHQARARFDVNGFPQELFLRVNDSGMLESITLQRWGNPDKGPFQNAEFGGFVQEEKPFNGYTLPSKLRIGWFPDHSRFESDGEFFRVTIDRAEFY